MYVSTPHAFVGPDDPVVAKTYEGNRAFVIVGTIRDQQIQLSGDIDTIHRILTDALHQLEDLTRTCCPSGHGDPHLDGCWAEGDAEPTGEVGNDGSREMRAAEGIAAARHAIAAAPKPHPFRLDHRGECEACDLKWERTTGDALDQAHALADLDDDHAAEVA